MAVELVSVEDFLNRAGYTLEEIENKEVIQQFIVDQDLDIYVFDTVSEEMARRYVNCLVSGAPIAYDDLLNAEAAQWDGSDYSGLEQLALVAVNDANIKSLVIDYTLQKAYYSPEGYIVDDVCYCKKEIPLTQELINAVNGILAGADLSRAKNEYIGDESARMSVDLAFRMKGQVYRYSATGANSGMPQQTWEACYAIIKVFANA